MGFPRRTQWVYFFIWSLTWINIWRIEETTKYYEKLGDLLFLLLFIYWRFMGSCAALRGFCTRIWIFTVLLHTYYSQFVLVYFCVYTHVLPLCCMPLRCSLVFVILPVSILLVFMPLFQNFSSFFYCSSPTEDPMVFWLSIVWRGARSPRHIIEVLTTCLLITIFLFIIHFVFLFYS